MKMKGSSVTLELHHFFILVESGARVGDALLALGMEEGKPNTHPGQGTANRRFPFSNGMLELLFVNNEREALSGPGAEMQLAVRANNNTACPFGLVFSRTVESLPNQPFTGWQYQPAYFEPPKGFLIGNNSADIREPLCIYMPFVKPGSLIKASSEREFTAVTDVIVHVPLTEFSDVLAAVNGVDRLSIQQGSGYLIEVTFDNNRRNKRADLLPDLPLVVSW